MAAYGTATSPLALLEAMRDKALLDTSKIAYVGGVHIVNGIDTRQVRATEVYLKWTGSPEEFLGDSDQLLTATHQVQIIVSQYTTTPEAEKTVVGTGHEPGIIQVSSDVIDFYANNMLGLTGLMEPGPTCEVVSVNTLPIGEEEEAFLVTAVINYEARTRPFKRTRVA